MAIFGSQVIQVISELTNQINTGCLSRVVLILVDKYGRSANKRYPTQGLQVG